MAEVKNQSSEEQQQHSPLAAKRKPDVECLDQIEDPKRKKLEIQESPKEDNLNNKENEDADNDDDDDDDEESDDDDDENGEEEEEEEVVIDRKGKGITREDKGKGKMVIEEDEEGDEDDDSDLSDRFNGSDDEETDLDDDPLAEVDLDNILPSRTRRRVPPPPGAYEVNDFGNDDDSEDSDA